MQRFLLRKANARFLHAETKWTSQWRQSAYTLCGASVFCILVGTLLVLQYTSLSGLTRRLRRNGENAVAIVIAKRTAGQDDNEYFVTIQFTTRANRLITKEGRISDSSFAQLKVGDRTTVWYVPQNPEVCLLESSMRFPVKTLVSVIAWWIASLLLLSYLSARFVLHRRFARSGQVLDGSLLDAKLSSGGVDNATEVEVSYEFVAPTGKLIRGTAKGNLFGSNLSELARAGLSILQSEYNEASVAVLYLKEDLYVLL